MRFWYSEQSVNLKERRKVVLGWERGKRTRVRAWHEEASHLSIVALSLVSL